MGGRNYLPWIRRSSLRVATPEEPSHRGRRHFLRTAALHGASIPVVHFALSATFGSGESAGAAGSARAPVAPPRAGKIGDDFASPYLELVRTLREAAEVEHALMLQYLYAGFSPQPGYLAILPSAAAGATDLIDIAMQK